MDKKDYSRKNAKALRHTLRAVKGRSFAPLRPGVSILLLLSSLLILPGLGALPTLSQTKRVSTFDPDGAFWILGDQPTEFSEFGGINLNARKLRRLPPAGLQLNDGTNYRFQTLTVKRNKLAFTTINRRGVYYTFSGRFLRGGVFAMTELNDERAVLEGTLTRYRGATKEAEAKLRFHYFGGT